jgi:protein-L-isoaspartate(D-aspartate) O-methyltransferase
MVYHLRTKENHSGDGHLKENDFAGQLFPSWRGDKMEYIREREQMVESQIRARGIRDQRVLDAMRTVPRHLFVEKGLYGQAYEDYPLPIGEEQTISQPYMVALMTEAMELTPTDIVLEIGTGCGYQAAVLAEIAARVYSIERIPFLAARAQKTLAELGYENVFITSGDGTLGWKEHAPFDAIITTAGAPTIPEPLKEQLADGGRLVIPVGDRFSQDLIKVTRKGNTFSQANMGGCRFVKLIGEYGWGG